MDYLADIVYLMDMFVRVRTGNTLNFTLLWFYSVLFLGLTTCLGFPFGNLKWAGEQGYIIFQNALICLFQISVSI